MEKILYKLAGSLSHDFSASWCLVFQNMSIQYGHLPYKIISRGSHLVGSWALTKLSTSCNPMFLTEVDYLVHERSIKRPKPYFLCVKSRWQRRTAHRSSTKSGFFDRALLGSQVNFATSKNWQSHNPEVHLDYVGWPKKERYKVFTIEACHFSPHSFVCFKNLKYWEAPKIKKTLWWSFTYKKWQQQPKPSSNLWKLKHQGPLTVWRVLIPLHRPRRIHVFGVITAIRSWNCPVPQWVFLWLESWDHEPRWWGCIQKNCMFFITEYTLQKLR